MSYKNLRSCLLDLKKKGELIEINFETDANQEMAEIHRRVFDQGGPAIWFKKVKGSPFEAASNIYGTYERAEYLFRDVLRKMEFLIKAKVDLSELIRSPLKALGSLPFILKGIPLKSFGTPPVLKHSTLIEKLPLIKSWPEDGGGFVTLPQVISFPPGSKRMAHANIGMYRIQLNGNDYSLNEEIGLHYQLHRGIGIHHSEFNRTSDEFKITIAVGGPPSHALGSIFPLPEGMSEVLFTGLLGNRSYRYTWMDGYFIPSDADFCITGIVQKKGLKAEGPFGDHLGYYSLTHPFPFMKVKGVYHRPDPIWHFTVVGRPPQEDSSFGHLIHQMVRELTSDEFKGVKEIHAVDAAGVHPLLLAIGSERYMPFRDLRPEEIITQAFHILGKGQTSLAKYLFICSDHDKQNLSTKNIRDYFDYLLKRVDWTRDLHFVTRTTIDTLDYSGEGWNEGSKLIVSVHGHVKRELHPDLPNGNKPVGLKNLHLVQPGIVTAELSEFTHYPAEKNRMAQLESELDIPEWAGHPLLVICDDAGFSAANLNNFLWVTFTRSNPSQDVYGAGSFIKDKHWGCKGTLIIDARKKSHHAPELKSDPAISERVSKILRETRGLENYA